MIVRPIFSKEELDLVYHFIHDAFVGQGYIEQRDDGRLSYYAHLDEIPETTVMIAMTSPIVGTHTLTFDGPSGLPSDDDFPEETKRIRAEGKVLCAAWRLATATPTDRKIYLQLTQATIALALKMGADTCLTIVHPHHEAAHRRMLRAQTVARREATQVLANAPAVLMRIDRERLALTPK